MLVASENVAQRRVEILHYPCEIALVYSSREMFFPTLFSSSKSGSRTDALKCERNLLSRQWYLLEVKLFFWQVLGTLSFSPRI